MSGLGHPGAGGSYGVGPFVHLFDQGGHLVHEMGGFLDALSLLLSASGNPLGGLSHLLDVGAGLNDQLGLLACALSHLLNRRRYLLSSLASLFGASRQLTRGYP